MTNFYSIYSSSDSNKNIICEHYGCKGLSHLFQLSNPSKFSYSQYNSNNNLILILL